MLSQLYLNSNKNRIRWNRYGGHQWDSSHDSFHILFIWPATNNLGCAYTGTLGINYELL